MRIADRTYGKLAVQGYCLSADEAARLRAGLRFPTGLCLSLAALGPALESAPPILGLAASGAIAGVAPRHPFDLVSNHGARHLTGGLGLPPNRAPRRHAFEVATGWLAGIGALLAGGEDALVLALGLGLALVGACALVPATSFRIPSTLLALLREPKGVSR